MNQGEKVGRRTAICLPNWGGGFVTRGSSILCTYVLRSTESEVWSLREIASTPHFAAFSSCNPTNLYWLGINKELFLSAIHFHDNPLT